MSEFNVEYVEVLTGIHTEKLAEIVRDFKRSGANKLTKELQSDGLYKVTAVFKNLAAS